MTQTFGKEVLTDSYLSHYTWPERDPRELPLTTRVRNDQDRHTLALAATNFTLNWPDFIKSTRSLDPADQLHALLNKPAFQFNKKDEFRDEPFWRDRIGAKASAGEPVQIVYPLICKIGNGAKLLDAHGPTAGEDAILLFLDRLAALGRDIYPPGLEIHLLSDAVFYNTAFLNSAVETGYYLNAVRRRAVELGVAQNVKIHDFAALIEPFTPEFEASYRRHYAALRANPLDQIGADDYARLLASTRATINTRQLGLTYDDLRAVFGPNPDLTHPAYVEIDWRARQALTEQLALKRAIYELKLADRLFPGHVRATCHKGRKEGRAILGLRAYPEYYGRSKLLPYHGASLITPNGESFRLVVEPEIVLRGRADLVRVTDEDGRTWFYQGAAA